MYIFGLNLLIATQLNGKMVTEGFISKLYTTEKFIYKVNYSLG